MCRRRGKPLYNVEPLMTGDQYTKHRCVGGVLVGGMRGRDFVRSWGFTPQAYSHFTYERSERRMVVTDIQGIEDLFTDPQVHTADGEGYGQGNLGIDGVHKFLCTHKCNDVCRAIGLRQPKVLPIELCLRCPRPPLQPIAFCSPRALDRGRRHKLWVLLMYLKRF